MAVSDDSDTEGPVVDESVAAAAGAVGDEMLAGQTDEQQAIAGRIFERLKAGADVDDVKELIGDLSRTATAEQQRQEHREPKGYPEQDLEQEWEWQWDEIR